MEAVLFAMARLCVSDDCRRFGFALATSGLNLFDAGVQELDLKRGCGLERLPDWWLEAAQNKCGRSSKLTFLRCNCADSFYLEPLKGRIEHLASETSFNHSSFREKCLGRGRVRGIMQLCSSQPRLLCIIGRRKARLLRLALFAMNLPLTAHITLPS